MLDSTLGQVVSWYICTAAAGLFLVMRIAVRWRKMGGLYVDDYLIAAAFGCLVIDLAIQQRMYNIGLTDMAHVTRPHFVEMMKLIFPGSIFYTLSLWLIKSALVVFYKRLADRTSLQKVYNATLVWLLVSYLVIFFDTLFRCYPFSRIWSTDPSQACPPSASVINYWITITLNISTDVLIICLPLTMVARLKLPLKQKLGVAAVFALGFCTVVASIIRAVYSHRNETMLTCTVSMVETAVAIIATCLPTLRVLILGHTSRNGTYPSRGYELGSSAQAKNSHLASHNHATVSGGSHNKVRTKNGVPITRTDSEDELVKELAVYGSHMPANPKNVIFKNSSDKDAIEVTTEFAVYPDSIRTVDIHTPDQQV